MTEVEKEIFEVLEGAANKVKSIINKLPEREDQIKLRERHEDWGEFFEGYLKD